MGVCGESAEPQFIIAAILASTVARFWSRSSFVSVLTSKSSMLSTNGSGEVVLVEGAGLETAASLIFRYLGAKTGERGALRE